MDTENKFVNIEDTKDDTNVEIKDETKNDDIKTETKTETKLDEVKLSEPSVMTSMSFDFSAYMNKILKLYKIVFRSIDKPLYDKTSLDVSMESQTIGSVDMSDMMQTAIKKSFDDVFYINQESEILAKQMEFIPKLYNAIFYYYMKKHDITFPIQKLPKNSNQLTLYFATLETSTDIVRDDLLYVVNEKTFNELRSEPPFHLMGSMEIKEMKTYLQTYEKKIKLLIEYLAMM